MRGGGGHHLVSDSHTDHIIQKKEGSGNSVSCDDQIFALQVPHSNQYTVLLVKVTIYQ